MASSPGSSTPETTPQRLTAINRSFTVPSKLATPPRPPNAPTELTSKDMEMLYKHPNARIVKFTASSSKLSSSNSPGRPQSSSGTLPWASPTEGIQASGPLEIYRVPVTGVSFLHSGTFLKPILKRSQCWCVDGVSKFAIAAGPDTYYRIELPGESDEDLEKVEELKETLQKVLFYEKTACPFKRSFTVELPEEEVLEVRKKRRRNTEGKAKKWKLDRAYGWRPEGWEPGMAEPEEDEAGSASADGSSAGSEEEADSASGADESDDLADVAKDAAAGPSARAIAVEKLRSASAPQQSIQHVPSPSRLRTKMYVDGTVEVQEETAAGAGDGSRDGEVPTLRTFQAIPTDMPPSPPDSSAGLESVDIQGPLENAIGDQIDEGDVKPGAESAQTVGAERGTAALSRDSGEVDEEEDEDSLHQSRSEDVIQTSGVSGPISRHAETSLRLEPTGDGETDTVPSINDSAVASVTTAINTIDANARELQLPLEPTLVDNNKDEESRDIDDALDGTIDIVEEDLQPTDSPSALTREAKATSEVNEEDIAKSETSSPREQPNVQNDHEERATTPNNLSEGDQSEKESSEDRPTTPPNRSTSEQDPYAAIQARILARRSLSGTTSFHLLHKSPTRSSTSSTSSSATIISNKASKASQRRARGQRDDVSTSLVNRAYSVFLGPPAHLVAIMLNIAARFANGAFGVNSMFYVESPIDSPRKVPGSYRLRGDHIEEVSSSSEGEEGWEDREDDFGVPLDRPASKVAEPGLRERSFRSAELD